jgi:hypothetical protein
LFRHLWEVKLTYRYIFAFKFTLGSQQPNIVPIICKFADTIGIVDTAANLPVSLSPVANFPPVSTTLAKLVAKFAASVVDTSGAP